MKFDFKLSPLGEQMFSDAMNNEQTEANTYISKLGITENTVVKHRNRLYTMLRCRRKDILSHSQSLFGTRITKDGNLGNEENIWDHFEIVKTDA